MDQQLPQQSHDEELKTIRTFQSDIALAIKEKQGSVVKIAVAEQERKRQEREASDPTTGSNKTYIMLGLLLLILGIGGVGYVLWNKQQSVAPVPLIQKDIISGDIHVDSLITVPLSGTDGDVVEKTIFDAVKNVPINNGKIVRLALVDGAAQPSLPLSLDRFFDLMNTHATPSLVRSLVLDNFTLGVYTNDTPHLFLLFRSASYPSTFSGMLAWERYMSDDIDTLFSGVVHRVTHADTTFKDKVIYNQDTRVLSESDGTPLIIYTFLGEKKDLLLITNDPKTIGAVVDRLTSISQKR